MVKRTRDLSKERQEADARVGAKRVGVRDLAPPEPVESVDQSILDKTSTILAEQEAMAAAGYDPNNINLDEVEMRIGLLARAILEKELRGKGMTPKDRCDIALRCISVLEGSKQEITWKDELSRKPKPITIEAYRAERAKKEAALKRMLIRKNEVKLAQAEAAVAELERKKRMLEERNKRGKNGEQATAE